MQLSCAFATSVDTPEHITIAEDLGYERAWCYDSPALYSDVWMVLAQAAARTTTIGLGPGVLVPSLRHPMVNAAAIATLAHLAPGRTAVAVGAGFTGRYVLGQRPMRWADVADYVRCLRALLRGEEATWEGATVRMLQPQGFTAARPVDVPILIGVGGPKGLAVAKELADGAFCAAQLTPGASELRHVALLAFGTVLEEGEAASSPRVRAAAGHAVAVVYHAIYEQGGDAVDGFPGGQAWREATEAVAAERRHLAVHEGHLVEANERDALALDAAPDLAASLTLTGTADDVRARVEALALTGVTELAYQPAGPDIRRELEAFARAVGR
ncbi:MAG: LLM class flavin-dependent oxidoreductase [Actinomycetota bacterium]